MIALVLVLLAASLDDHPLTAEQRTRLNDDLDSAIQKWTGRIKEEPKSVESYSHRGDALFMRGRFADSLADYEKMVDLDATLDAGHWRRGIAYFYAGKYEQASHQFEIYHTHDDVDRENGIWRYLSQVKAHGVEKARKGLLKYAKDDREPFPAVYQLFEGKTTPDKIFEQIRSASVDDEEREKRLFYANLYAGLNLAVENKPDEAAKVLRGAVANTWAPKGGFGPSFMWHVARLQYEELRRAKKE